MERCVGFFSGVGAIRKMLEDVSLDSADITSGSRTEEVFATAVAVTKLDTLTPAHLNFKSVRPATCAMCGGSCTFLLLV